MTACPDREMALHAMVDGELDSMASVALETHLRSCPGCRAALDRLEATRALLADHDLRYLAPPGLHDKIAAILPDERAAPARVQSRTAAPAAWLGGGVIGALAASIALFLALPQLSEGGLEDELVAAQVRSLQAAHLTDIPTSDRHVVKPWFNGRIDFSPPVVELAPQGFPLVGGRLDYIGGRDVAAIVYRRRLHTINLFVRPAPSLASPVSATVRHQSYNLVRWVSGGLEFWAVSDVDAADLALFRDAFRKASHS